MWVFGIHLLKIYESLRVFIAQCVFQRFFRQGICRVKFDIRFDRHLKSVDWYLKILDQQSLIYDIFIIIFFG